MVDGGYPAAFKSLSFDSGDGGGQGDGGQKEGVFKSGFSDGGDRFSFNYFGDDQIAGGIVTSGDGDGWSGGIVDEFVDSLS